MASEPTVGIITPGDIRKKAESLYPELLRAHLEGDTSFFPRPIRCRKTFASGTGMVTAMEAIHQLRKGSKTALGCGYSIEWREINSRSYSRNQFPDKIIFDTELDFLRFIKKDKEFATFQNAVSCLRATHPELEEWMRRNTKALIEVASDLSGLIQVILYFKEHPRPDCFARELPLSVDTKFIERHKSLLRRWLDIVLPPHTIRSDEDHFERRYGLRYDEPHILVRFLDAEVRTEIGFPCEVVTVPLHTLAGFTVKSTRIIIVENKVNLLTLPPLERTLAFGGLGTAVTLLRYCEWLGTCPIIYWGDIDVEGFGILSSLRSCFPHAESIMMDRATLECGSDCHVSGTGAGSKCPAHLTLEEVETYSICAHRNLRLEQERIPHEVCLNMLLKQTHIL